MMNRIVLRGFALTAAIAAAFFGAACGGGGAAGSDDLVLEQFQLVDHELRNIGGSGATNAYRDTRILLIFNEPVDPDSVSDRTIKIGIPVAQPGGNDLLNEAIGRFSVVPGHPNWVLFDPTITANNQTSVHDNPFGLLGNAQYDVQIPSVLNSAKYLMSDAGKPLVQSYTFNFSTSDDYLQNFIQPELVTTFPKEGQTGVSPTGDIILTFTEPMRPDTFRLNETVFVRDLTNDIPVLGQMRFSADAKTVTFRPIFGYGKGPYNIFLRVTTEAANLAGNPIPNEVRLSFWTLGDPTQPDFEDITEEFEDKSFEDTTFTALYPLAAWNEGVTVGFLAGKFTTGVIERSNTLATYAYAPFGMGNSLQLQWQHLIPQSELGGAKTVTGVDWYYNAQNASNTVTNVQIRMGHSKLANLTTTPTTNFSDSPVTLATVNSYFITNVPSQGWMALPTFTTPFRYNGADNAILEIFCNCSATGGPGTNLFNGLWRLMTTTSQFQRTAYTQTSGAFATLPYEYHYRIHYLIEQSEAQSKWYDAGILSPQFLDAVTDPPTSSQPVGTSTVLTFQGAPTDIETGLPDEDLVSIWTNDLTKLSGYRFIRWHAVMTGNQATGQVPLYDSIILPFIFF